MKFKIEISISKDKNGEEGRMVLPNGIPRGAKTARRPPTTKAVKSPFADCIPGLSLEPRGDHSTDPFEEQD